MSKRLIGPLAGLTAVLVLVILGLLAPGAYAWGSGAEAGAEAGGGAEAGVADQVSTHADGQLGEDAQAGNGHENGNCHGNEDVTPFP